MPRKRKPVEVKVLVVDIGGTHVKFQVPLPPDQDQPERRAFDSGSELSPGSMVEQLLAQTQDWECEAVTLGYPGPVGDNRILAEPANLGPGWVDFDFGAAFGKPVRLINDAAMQALGSYQGGKLLFLGLGTGLGTAMVFPQQIVPLELAHLPFRKATFEDYVGLRGLEKYGKKKWRKRVSEVIGLLRAALVADDVVLGGGQTKKLKELPEGCRLGDNANAFLGGYRLWNEPQGPRL
ncbi:ROK family protein [bacterium SCN 62-11]|nr:MAG: ROK family protein [bacterium SCN 62-11]